MIDPNETHERIIKVLNEKGPSLPINIAKEVDMSSLFIAAFLSELTDSKRIKVSNLKVGGTPLYFMEGQEELLENFHKYLHPKETEAFLLLKEKKVLKDINQEPAIRVALRAIKDFAIGFRINQDIYWRYMLAPESEIRNLFSKTPNVNKKQEKKVIVPAPRLIPKKVVKSVQSASNNFQNPLVTTIPTKKEKSKPEFVEKVINFINTHYKIIEEKDYKAKEYNCITQIKSQLGPINVLTLAKNKKSITETDLKKHLSNAQTIPLPGLFIYTGKLSKKAQEYEEKYFSILKTVKIK
ncbi:hypothetical protein GOV14_02725 [Candidatus Pacearchaeota archaeon]|nr:hypothetical protein [Candidatus Pacearchaeota archaeon]